MKLNRTAHRLLAILLIVLLLAQPLGALAASTDSGQTNSSEIEMDGQSASDVLQPDQNQEGATPDSATGQVQIISESESADTESGDSADTATNDGSGEVSTGSDSDSVETDTGSDTESSETGTASESDAELEIDTGSGQNDSSIQVSDDTLEPDTGPTPAEEAPKIISEFTFSSQTFYSTKGEIESTIALFPETLDVSLIDGSADVIPVSWSCLDDYSNTEYDIYTFVPNLPESYVLADGFDEWLMPYIDVKIVFESSAPYRAGPPNWQTVNSNTILDSEYGFSFNTQYRDVSDGQGRYSKSTSVGWGYCDIGTQAWKSYYGLSTEAEVATIEGGDHWVTQLDSSHPASYWCDGRIWFRWNNVGYYNGKIIDMKVTLIGIEQLSIVGSAGIFFVEDQPGVVLASTSGITHPTFRYEFFERGTNNPVSVKGHATFFDLDAGQGLKLGENMVAGYYLNTGHLFIGSGAHENFLQASPSSTTNTDTAGWLTALFSGSYFTVTFCVGSGQDGSTWISPPGQNFADPNLGGSQAALFGFRGDSVGPFDTPTVTKRVSATSVYTDQSFTYYLEIPIPLESPSYYYSGFLLEDTVPSQLIITNPSGIKVIDKTNNRDITSWFANNSTSSKLSLSPNPSNPATAQSSFYGITIEVSIPVAIRSGVSAASWQSFPISNNGRQVSNQAWIHVARTAIAGGASQIKSSNSVSTCVSAKTQVQVINGSSSWSSNSNNCSASNESGYTVRKVPAGDNIVYSFSGNSNYRLKSVTVNGKPIDISGYGNTFDYSFPNIQGQENRILVEYEINPGRISITKRSAAPEITDENGCYSLAGAVYSVYTDAGLTNFVCNLTIGSDGTATSGELVPQTYYVVESKAPTGYLLDETVHTVAVSAGETKMIQLTDEPKNDPVGITLNKIQETVNDYIPSLAGAEFTIRYYDGQYSSVDQLPAAPTRSWVISTQEVGNGYLAILDEDYLKEGDPLYYRDGKVVLPLGTISIQETRPPLGYTTEGGYLSDSTGQTVQASNGVVLLNVTSDDAAQNGASIVGGNYYTKMERYQYCSITLHKRADGGSVIEGAQFKLEILNPTTKNYDVLETGVTNDDGDLVFNNLVFGQYRITELSTESGASLMADPIIVTLPVTTAQEAGGTPPTYSQDGTDYYCDITFTVQNGVIFMPHAGGIGVLPMSIAGMILLGTAGTIVLFSKRRRVK